jgi:uncharacterized membrane protein
MDLSPEERRRIYEEEKASIEAEERLEKERRAAEASTTKLEPNIAGLLCYLGIWISGIVFLVIEQRDRFVRFHAMQSVIVFVFLGIAGAIVYQVPFVGWFLRIITGILTFVLWVVLMIKASQGELYKFPVAGDLADRLLDLIGRGDVETAQKGEHPETAEVVEHALPVTADESAQKGRRLVEPAKGAKSIRTASSSVAIAWSIVLLVFFNFFNRYVAYYQYDDGRWIRHPFLTQDVNLWLPILTTTLICTIAGHIILIIYDRYVLREITVIILSLFGIWTVGSLLSVFPFDFSVIPHNIVADISPIIVTIVLLAIILGLVIGAIVRFIRLIANVARGTPEF